MTRVNPLRPRTTRTVPRRVSRNPSAAPKTTTCSTSCTRRVRPACPKGVVHTHTTAMWGVFTIHATADYQSGERILPVSMFHVGALTPLTINAYHGATTYVMRSFDPVAAWECVQREKITSGLMVPAMLNFYGPGA